MAAEELDLVGDHRLVLGPVVDVEVVDAGIGAQLAEGRPFRRVARPGPAIAAARRAPLGELRTYPGVDHFDIYDGPEFEAVVADEVTFLRRHLLASG